MPATEAHLFEQFKQWAHSPNTTPQQQGTRVASAARVDGQGVPSVGWETVIVETEAGGYL